MTQNEGPGLRERKRVETRRRIAEAAVRLTTEHGIASTTVDQIAESAGVSRATFFRYFESKELAIATGLSEVAVYVLISVLSELPAELGPLEAVRASHAAIGAIYQPDHAELLEQAQLSTESPAMRAWTLQLYVEWEIAIAELIAPRFDDLVPGDPRPRMIGAMNMAAIRLARDEWIEADGELDLFELVQKYLDAIEVPSLQRR
jgi:AcrR family transcriptional regulator